MVTTEQVCLGSLRLWVEMTWVGFFALLSLGSAATTTALVHVTACGILQPETDPQFCVSSKGVVVTNWLTTIIYLGWFTTLISYGITRSSSNQSIWFKYIKDVDSTPSGVPDVTLDEKFKRLPALHHSPEVRVSDYSMSTGKTEKDDISIVMPHNYRSGPIGVDAINGAPVYHPYSTTNAWNQRNTGQGRTITPIPASIGSLGSPDYPQTVEVPPRRAFFAPRSYALSAGGSSVEPSANAGSNPSSGFEWINTAYKNTASPSPAVIMQVHKVPPQQSLYVAHATGAEEHRRTRSNTDPTHEQWFSAPSRKQPDRSSVALVEYRRPSEPGTSLTHAPTLSTDSAFRTGSKKPKYRPPPLDLSRLSNITQAEKR